MKPIEQLKEELCTVKEIWKEVEWSDRYLVSDLWNVMTLSDRHWKERLMKPNINSHWYLRVRLDTKIHTVHQLVMRTFVWKQNWLDVNHINGVKTDNRLVNLEYTTRSENEKHSYRELWKVNWMKWKFWKLNHRSKAVDQYDLDWNFIKQFESISLASKEVGGSSTNISKCCKGKYRSAYWYKWKPVTK